MSLSLMVLATLTAIIGLACLSLSQDKHWRVVRPSKTAVPRVRELRMVGYGLLVVCAALCIARDGISFSLILWPLTVGISAIVIGMTIAYRPVLLKPLASLAAQEAKA